MKIKLRNQKGFTLIEIIAVLIILGILAAVAVPKFLNLTSDAEDKAIEGALAAGMSTCSMQFARLALSTGSAPGATAVATAAGNNAPGSDDFDYTFTGATSVVTVKAKWSNASARTGSTSADWELPR